MVRIEKDRLVIEMETRSPEDDIHQLQQALPNLLFSMEIDCLQGKDLQTLMTLVGALMPTFEQLKQIREKGGKK